MVYIQISHARVRILASRYLPRITVIIEARPRLSPDCVRHRQDLRFVLHFRHRVVNDGRFTKGEVNIEIHMYITGTSCMMCWNTGINYLIRTQRIWTPNRPRSKIVRHPCDQLALSRHYDLIERLRSFQQRIPQPTKGIP